jgi:hypothetical protein
VRGLVLGSTQPPSQQVVLPPQVAAQAPLEQTCPAGQAMPQAPQFARSVWVSRQVPPQSTVPLPQFARHVPATQAKPAAQVEPHAPQLPGSIWGFAQ